VGFLGTGQGRNSRGGYGRGGQNQDQEKDNGEYVDQKSNTLHGGKMEIDRKRIKCLNCNRLRHLFHRV